MIWIKAVEIDREALSLFKAMETPGSPDSVDLNELRDPPEPADCDRDARAVGVRYS